MRILVDADGCPVVDNTIKIAKLFGLEVILLCDTSHILERSGIKTITLSKGADSVDFALVNMAQKGDIAVTQDYGLAAMCLSRGMFPINQDGMLYTDNNIDALLFFRHTAKKIRNAGGRLKGIPKRTNAQNKAFEQSLTALIKNLI